MLSKIAVNGGKIALCEFPALEWNSMDLAGLHLNSSKKIQYVIVIIFQRILF
jgi:hypothetical protein